MGDAFHHILELSEGNDAISVVVALSNYFFNFFVHLLVFSKSEDLPNLLQRNGSGVVIIEHFERAFKLGSRHQVVSPHG